MSKLIIAEKPSVAKSIASALGASSRADGFYEGSGLLVSWCVGHLVSPMDAGGYDERFKKWRYDDLPILPKPFRYVLAPGKEDAFENLRAFLAAAGKAVVEKAAVLSTTAKRADTIFVIKLCFILVSLRFLILSVALLQHTFRRK